MGENNNNNMCVGKIQSYMVKLQYIYDIQDSETWYLDVMKVGKKELAVVNDQYAKNFANDVYSIGLNLGGSFTGKELMVDLYKFNESLTRLVSQKSGCYLDEAVSVFNEELRTINGEEETINDQEHDDNKIKLDSALILKTIIKLLIFKLSKIVDIISSSDVKLSNIEHKLIDDILAKNISNRILKPYHNLMYIKAGTLMSNVYS